MLEGVQADGSLPLRRLGAGALKGVPSIGFGFLLARHDIDPLRSIRVDNVNRIVGQIGCTSSPDFLSSASQAEGSSLLCHTTLWVEIQWTTRYRTLHCPRWAAKCGSLPTGTLAR